MPMPAPRCPGCFAPISGCLCTGADQRRAEREALEWRRGRVLVGARLGETCVYNLGKGEEDDICGAPAAQAIMAGSARYGVCRAHLKYAEGAPLAHEADAAPPSLFACPACRTNITALPCTHCGFAGGAAGYAAVPQRSVSRRSVLPGIVALALLRKVPREGPYDED